MDAPIKKYISEQPESRQQLLSEIHSIIIAEDKTIVPRIGLMMRNEMILYEEAGVMKYGLSSVKKHISLHLLPIYMSPELFSKYQSLLSKASFQKGCINFETAEQMPADVVRRLMADSSKIDMAKIREKYQKQRK